MIHLWKDFISDNCCPRGAVYNSPKIRDNNIIIFAAAAELYGECAFGIA